MPVCVVVYVYFIKNDLSRTKLFQLKDVSLRLRIWANLFILTALHLFRTIPFNYSCKRNTSLYHQEGSSLQK
jgi:hypothetical protein